MDQQVNADACPHHLLTALGVSPQMATYALNGETAEAEYSPLALLQLLDTDDRPDTVLCLLTSKAREQVWDDFSKQVKGLGVGAEPIDIPDVDNSAQMAEVIQTIAQTIRPDSRLMLDITHGPRHIPFVFYALTLYLSGFRDVEITGAWYGNFQSAKTDKPLIDLQPLLNLPQWFYAIRMFQETGFTQALAERFTVVCGNLPKGPERGPSSKVAEALEAFSTHYEAGLPMELGLAAGKLCHGLEEKPLEDMPGLNLPLARELSEVILEAAKPVRFASESLSNGRGSGEWKTEFPLKKKELRRQADLIDQYLERNQFSLGIGLIREWTVSLGVLYRNPGANWMKRTVRIKLERELGAMCKKSLRQYLDDEQKQWGTFWDQLGKQRNQFAHHGMKPEVAKTNLDEIMYFWQKIKLGDRVWTSFGGGNGHLLVTPLGMSPGVLFSALKKVQPDSVLVLCSEQAKAGITDALNHSAFSGKCESLIMRDPFNGIDEIGELLQKSRKACLDADEVQVNLTGGTTMMGIAVQRIYEQSRNDQRPCRRFVLTDKRPPEEQKRKLWVEADIFWLDKTSNQGEGND